MDGQFRRLPLRDCQLNARVVVIFLKDVRQVDRSRLRTNVDLHGSGIPRARSMACNVHCGHSGRRRGNRHSTDRFVTLSHSASSKPTTGSAAENSE